MWLLHRYIVLLQTSYTAGVGNSFGLRATLETIGKFAYSNHCKLQLKEYQILALHFEI
jgi:hypothetical protein